MTGTVFDRPADVRPFALAGISGPGDLAVDADGTHRIWLDYELG